MNRAIFWRLIWKEYRLQRSFWIAMAVLAALVLFLVWALSDPRELIASLFGFALGAAVIYALASASTTFAGEHDAGTYQFQRSLPVTASRLFWSKIAFTFLSTLAMFVLLWFLAFWLAGWQLPVAEYYRGESLILNMMAIAGAVALMFIILGVFFSLILKRSLLAVIVSMSAALIVPTLIEGILGFKFHRRGSDFPYFLFIIIGFYILLALVDVWLGRHWFCETLHLRLRLKQLANFKTTKPLTLAEYLSQPNFWSMLRRLTWQHWRQSVWVGIVILTMFAAMGLVDIATLRELQKSGGISLSGWIHGLGFTAYITLLLIPLLGSFTFLADQRQRNFRFFSERGISPRLVWLSRLWPWLLIVIVWFVLYAVYFTALLWIGKNYSTDITYCLILSVLEYLLAYLVLSVCVGQLCSMFFRGGLLAGLFSLVITAILAFWAALMLLWGMNWLWSVAPIFIILPLATWLRAPDWILERNGLRTWLRPGLVLAVPTIILFAAVSFYHVYEIPVVDPGFSVEEFQKPLMTEELATRDLYRKIGEIDWSPKSENEKVKDNTKENIVEKEPVYADSTLPKSLSANDIDFVETNQKVISLLIEASKGPQRIRSYSPGMNRYDELSRKRISYLIISSAMKQEADGQLDAALEQYLAAIRISRQFEDESLELRVYDLLPFWATRPNQTAERIKNAAGQLEKLTTNVPVDDWEIKLEYIITREIITKGFNNYNKKYLNYDHILWRLFPWERARALRLLNTMIRDDLEEIRKAESDTWAGKPLDIAPGKPYYFSYFEYITRIEYASHIFDARLLYQHRISKYLIWQYARMENRRRAIRILLALQAWKLDHGGYPKTLDELVGPYFEKLPNDPFSGDSYQYFPEGVKAEIPGPGMNFELLSSGKDKPFIWSTTPNIKIRSPSDKFWDRYLIYDDRAGYPYDTGRFYRPESIYEIYPNGQCFFLP